MTLQDWQLNSITFQDWKMKVYKFHNPEHKNIKTLRSSLAFAYAYATAVLTSS